MESLFDDEKVAAEEAVEEVGERAGNDAAIPLTADKEPLREEAAPAFPAEPIDNSRALALTDVIAPRSRPGETLIRLAYRMGVPGHALSAPLRRAAAVRILATVNSPVTGDRAAGTALRAGHFIAHGVKQPIGKLDFGPTARLSPGLERMVHSFSWLNDLAASAPREDCIAIAERITTRWKAFGLGC